ncbi:MAG: hybrid sensor histidine kinase/response regulator [Verrucomicrobia bacterium]|nr:hybrid sensor histidine kinase/response regulator [Verrucomicrobiota bacterium]
MKILHLEDNLHDAELSHGLLREEWPDCQIDVVANRVDFQAGLSAGCDLILSDFNMPGYNGLEALDLARKTTPLVPFIFMSGTIGEDRAIEALRSGASDYVLKDRPQRLVSAIQRALQGAKLSREKREAEEHLLRMQRLENIGMLAAGIAHDFNNVLAPIMMSMATLRMRHKDPLDERIFTNIERCSERGSGLVKQIMGFVKGVTGEPQVISPGELVGEVVAMSRQTFSRKIRVQGEVAPDLRRITANPTQLHQVLLNLCVNARDAMPAGGELWVRAQNADLLPEEARSLGIGAGAYILLTLSDTGTGIPAHVLERIWEPFFTTKGVGKGTGMGLWTVRSIVENHQGAITVETKPGSTTFRIWLPAESEPTAV